jgi:hypothetical protein
MNARARRWVAAWVIGAATVAAAACQSRDNGTERVGQLDARHAQERIHGRRDVLAGSSIRIADVRTDDGDDVRAKAVRGDRSFSPGSRPILVATRTVNRATVEFTTRINTRRGRS